MLRLNPGQWQLFMQRRTLSAMKRQGLGPPEDEKQPLTLVGKLLTWFSAFVAVEIGVFLIWAIGPSWRPAPVWSDWAVFFAVFVAPFALAFLPSLLTRISVRPMNVAFLLSACALAERATGYGPFGNMLIALGLIVAASATGAFAGSLLRKWRVRTRLRLMGQQP